MIPLAGTLSQRGTCSLIKGVAGWFGEFTRWLPKAGRTPFAYFLQTLDKTAQLCLPDRMTKASELRPTAANVLFSDDMFMVTFGRAARAAALDETRPSRRPSGMEMLGPPACQKISVNTR